VLRRKRGAVFLKVNLRRLTRGSEGIPPVQEHCSFSTFLLNSGNYSSISIPCGALVNCGSSEPPWVLVKEFT